MCELTKMFVFLLLALTLVGKCSLYLIWGRCVTAVPWLPRPIYLLEYIAAFFPSHMPWLLPQGNKDLVWREK